MSQGVPDGIGWPESLGIAQSVQAGKDPGEEAHSIRQTGSFFRNHVISERINPGHTLSDDHRVNVVRPLAGLTEGILAW